MANVNCEKKIPKVEPDTESQTRKRNLMGRNNSTGSSTSRKLSIDDVPENIRDLAVLQMEKIQVWPNHS